MNGNVTVCRQENRCGYLSPFIPDKAVSFDGWDLYEFWHHLEQSSEIIDNVLAGTGPSRWESLVVEAKRMNQRNTFIGGDDLCGMSVSFVSSYCLFHSFCEQH